MRERLAGYYHRNHKGTSSGTEHKIPTEFRYGLQKQRLLRRNFKRLSGQKNQPAANKQYGVQFTIITSESFEP